MSYSDHFKLADELLTHVAPLVSSLDDPFLQSRYTGFVSVAGVTVYELAIKQIFCDFGVAKHRVLGIFTQSYFDRLNGRIKYSILHEEYVSKFGDKYVAKFKKNVQKKNESYLRQYRKDILTCYNNLITWRNQFAHEGILPPNATFSDTVEAYELGKIVLACLADAMCR
ncbi:MAG: HEPN domain-containing protein [Rhizomicrobium sp.]|jgi:hypothetical protein